MNVAVNLSHKCTMAGPESAIPHRTPGASQIFGERVEFYCQFTVVQARLPESAPIHTSIDNLVLVWRLPGGDRCGYGHQIEHAVTSRQSCLAPVACARLTSTVGRKCSVNDVLLHSGCPKRQIISPPVYLGSCREIDIRAHLVLQAGVSCRRRSAGRSAPR